MHSGNIRFRALIQKYKPVYRDTPKKMKPSVSTKVVAIWRSQEPPGRFLTRSDRFHGSRRTFYDVGDAMARRKAAQCLREKSSKERMTQHKEREESEEGSTEMSDKSSKDVEGVDCNLLQDEMRLVTSLGDSVRSAFEETDVCEQKGEGKSRTQNSGPEEQQNSILSSDSRMDSLPLSSANTTPSGFSKDFGLDLPLKLAPTPSKRMVLSGNTCKGAQCSDFFSFGSPKNDPMSLLDTYASKLEEQPIEGDRGQTSESPFLFASFGFENDHGESDSGEGGLCFPSLFGGDSGNTSSSLFDDGKEDKSPSFFNGGASALFDEPEEPEMPFAPAIVPPVQKKEALQNIRDIMPTAASLTSNLFDW